MTTVEPPIEDGPTSTSHIPPPIPNIFGLRTAYFLITVILPIILFATVGPLGPFDPNNQGDNAIVSILLGSNVAIWFAPLLIYAVGSLSLLLFQPMKFVQYPSVRFGIYTGTILAWQYIIISIVPLVFVREATLASIGAMLIPLAVYGISAVILVITTLTIGVFYEAIIAPHGLLVNAAAIIVIGVAFTIPFYILIVSLGSFDQRAFWFVSLFVLSGLPILCGAIFTHTARILLQHYESWAWNPVPAIIGWIVAYGITWYIAYLRMVETYQALPVNPPEGRCYIATAAAQGHPHIVKSWPITRADGVTLYINAQLQTLKAAELALLTTSPTLHRWLRRGYDWLGPRLAQQMTHPFIADAVYIALKPCEWLAGWLLGQLGPRVRESVRKLY